MSFKPKLFSLVALPHPYAIGDYHFFDQDIPYVGYHNYPPFAGLKRCILRELLDISSDLTPTFAHALG